MSNSEVQLFYQRIHYPLGQITVVYQPDQRAVAIAFDGETKQLAARLERQLKRAVILSKQVGWAYTHLLEEYFLGQRRTLEGIEYKLYCTPFQQRVLGLVRQIPYGNVRTYGELARELGERGYARAVGGAVARNPLPILIPCHRVVSTSGRGGFTPDPKIKEYLLTLERANRPEHR